MKVHRESRYLALARTAYATFFGKSTQVGFSDLSYEYQAKWIAVVKAVVQSRAEPSDQIETSNDEVSPYSPRKGESDEDWLARLPKRGSRISLMAIGPELASKVKRIQHNIAKDKKR